MLFQNSPRLIAVFIAVFTGYGCGKKADSSATVNPIGTGETASTMHELAAQRDPPTLITDQNKVSIREDEATAFGTSLESAIKERRISAATRLFGIERQLVARGLNDLNIPEANRTGFLSRSRKTENDLANQIYDHVKNGGKYAFLRVKIVNGVYHAFFRLVTPDSGLNYYDMTLSRLRDGHIVADDIYIYASAELLSQIIRRTFIRLAAEGALAPPPKPKGIDRPYSENLDKLLTLAIETQKGNAQTALAAYRSLPSDLKSEKSIQMLAVMAAQRCGNIDYQIEIENLRKNHAGDPAVEWASITYYFKNGRNIEAIAIIDRMNDSIGPDPYLHVLKGKIYAAIGNLAEGKKAFELAVKSDPTIETAYWGRIYIALKEENNWDTLTWLRRVVEILDKPVNFESIRTDPERIRLFVRGKEYTTFSDWYATRKKK